MDNKLLGKIHALEPIVKIGKNGLTENVINDIKTHLKNRNLIKVKLLRTFIQGKDKKEIAKDIANKTNSKVIQQVGFVVVLIKNG